MRRKLLIVTDEMEVGGTQRQIVELARLMQHSAYEVSVAYFRNGSRLVDELRALGVSVTCLDKRHRIDPGFFLRFCRFVRKENFDLIHAASFSGELWSWLANALAGQARLVVSIRGVYYWYRPWQWLLKRWITRSSSAVVANSQAGAEFAAMQMKLRCKTIHVVPNAIRLPTVPPVPDLADGQSGTWRILFVGRLDVVKNVPCLLRATRRLVRRHPELRVDIVGDGAARAALLHQCRELGIDGFVTFHGSQEDPGRFYGAAHVLVLPSFSEGFSNTLVEAMLAGCPVVASNVGGNAELVEHGRSGLLFPADDDEVLAEMVEELMNDEAQRQKMSSAARESARPWLDSQRMAVAMTEIYDRCLERQDQLLVER